MPDNTPVLIVIAGPAGSGKSTLCNRLVDTKPGFARVVTATTRPPRPGEQDGVDYHFLSPEAFDAEVAANSFLEWAWVHRKHRYGTLSRAVVEPLKNGTSLVINVDVQGVENFQKAALASSLLARSMATVFISVPEPELRLRLAGRGTDAQEEIDRRMRTALEEERHKERFDHIIISQDKDADFTRLVEIVEAARQRAAASA